VRNEALRMGEPPSLRFVFETSERIEINLLEEKAAMGFLKREEKPPEKVKIAKASCLLMLQILILLVSNVARLDICGRIVKTARLPRLRAEGFVLGAVSKDTMKSSAGSSTPN
jgi:hypothetical protein